MTYKLAISSTTDTSLKTLISTDVFLIKDYDDAVLLKEVLTAPFVERFKTTTLGKSY